MVTGGKGKSPFTHVHQIGVIVRDMDQAVAFYECLGMGPFDSPKGAAPIFDRQMYDKPAPDVKNRISTTQMGAVQLELVQPISGKSLQREFLEKHGEGVNHLAFLVDDLDGEVAKLVQKGFRVISSGRTAQSAFAYLDTNKVGGVVFELIQQSPST
jgi:4-hydroxyphenylpyruvate dioxygenase-like putative hemolysin